VKYKNLKQLKKALDNKEIPEEDAYIIVDNDTTFVYHGDTKVFEGGMPEDLLHEALELLGINSEPA
jgi:hypothetical protein